MKKRKDAVLSEDCIQLIILPDYFSVQTQIWLFTNSNPPSLQRKDAVSGTSSTWFQAGNHQIELSPAACIEVLQLELPISRISSSTCCLVT